MSAGNVLNVEETLGGSELAADAGSGSGTITVEDPTDFQPDGGELLIGAEEKGYSAINETTGVVTLDSNLASSYLAGEPVTVLPSMLERFAHVQLEGQDETMQARVPHGLWPMLPVGIRDENADELELVEVDRDPGGELVVADVLEREPVFDGAVIPEETLPEPEVTDGNPPASSPTPTVLGAILSLFVRWDAIANADPVMYEVYVATSSGFTPGPSNFAGQTAGTFMVIRNLPGTLNPPAYGTTYFVRIIARDADGAAAVGAEDSATPVEGTDDAIIAGMVAANAILAENLEAVLVLASTIIAGTDGGGRVELGLGMDTMEGMIGIHAFAPDGMTITFMVDSATGEVYMKGRVEWGTDSALLTDNILEFAQVEEGFVDGTIVQSGVGAASNSSICPVTVPTATHAGNLLLIALFIIDADGTPPTPTVPTNFTTVLQQDFASGSRLLIYKRENAPKTTSINNVALGDTCEAVSTFVELSGVSVQDNNGGTDLEASSSGTADPLLTGTTAVSVTQKGRAVSFFAWKHSSADLPVADPTDGSEHVNFRGFTYDGITGAWMGLRTTTKVVPSGTASSSQDVPASRAYAGAILVLKSKAGVDTPEADHGRLYFKDAGGVSVPTIKREDGVEGVLEHVNYGPLDLPWTKNVSTTLERTLIEAANNLPSTAGPVIPNVAGARFRIVVAGTYDHDNAGGTLTVRLKAGATSLDSRNISQPGADQSAQGFLIECELLVRTIGATANLRGTWRANFQGAGTPMIERGWSGTVDLTAAPRIDVTADFASSNGNNGVTVHYVHVERIG